MNTTEILKNITLKVALSLIIATTYPYTTYAAPKNLEEQKKILDLIKDFAVNICPKIPLEGSADTSELSGKVKIELDGLIKKIINLGGEGAAKYNRSEWQGGLQKDLVPLLKNNSDCRIAVMYHLTDKLMSSEPEIVTPKSETPKSEIPSSPSESASTPLIPYYNTESINWATNNAQIDHFGMPSMSVARQKYSAGIMVFNDLPLILSGPQNVQHMDFNLNKRYRRLKGSIGVDDLTLQAPGTDSKFGVIFLDVEKQRVLQRVELQKGELLKRINIGVEEVDRLTILFFGKGYIDIVNPILE